MADLSFRVAARRKDPITFTIDGDPHEYTFNPPKIASMVVPLMDKGVTDIEAGRAAFDWLDRGMSEEDREHMVARLNDESDDMDFDVIEDMVEGLIEAVGGRPTT